MARARAFPRGFSRILVVEGVKTWRRRSLASLCVFLGALLASADPRRREAFEVKGR
ncbi:unnamed protein product [Amoebophrya sp. A25]|nr:unnamed protein product [Amoebophrya sp. A25]|eukprot:GSA25T00017581001.1